MDKQVICTVCPKGCRLTVADGESFKVTGNSCQRGIDYGIKEVTNPTRVVTSTVKIKGGVHARLPVKTTAPIPKTKIMACMAIINKIEVIAPIKMNTILIENLFEEDIQIIATRDIDSL